MLSDAYYKAHKNLPKGAKYYNVRDDAIAQGGVLTEIMDYPSGVIYGVFGTQEMLLHNAAAYIKREQAKTMQIETTHIVVSLTHIIKTHRHLSRDECIAFQLPTEKCRWFDNETGGLTAFSLMDKKARYMVELRRVHDAVVMHYHDIKKSLHTAKTSNAFYGVFDSAEEWNNHRDHFRTMHLLYFEPPFPFKQGTLDYDRCRCTLMGIKDALHKAPALNPIPHDEAIQMGIPPSDAGCCFRTREDALKVGGCTVKWTPLGTAMTYYAVYVSAAVARAVMRQRTETLLTKFSWEMIDNLPMRGNEYKVISVPEGYGVIDNDDECVWNPNNIPQWTMDE
jgi:hypothetical protein